jgi:Dienelactone hydrolase family
MDATATPEACRAEVWRLLGGAAGGRAWRVAGRRAVTVGSGKTAAEELDLVAGDGTHARGFLTRPLRHSGDLPAILYCHAHGNRYDIGAAELLVGRPAFIDPPYGPVLGEAGFVVLAIDLACFGSRNAESESAAAKRMLWRGDTLFGDMLRDLKGAVDLLAGMDGVSAARIGAIGISMGATLAFWLSALDERISATAHLCCFADLGCLIETGAHDLHGPYMTVPGLLPAFSTGEIAGLVAPRPQLACMGLQDPLTPEPAVRKAVAEAGAAYRAAGAPQAFATLIDPETGHRETPAMRGAVLAFLQRNLLA